MNFFQRLLFPPKYSLIDTELLNSLCEEMAEWRQEISEYRREIERKNREIRILAGFGSSERNSLAIESIKLINLQEKIDRLEKELKLFKERQS